MKPAFLFLLLITSFTAYCQTDSIPAKKDTAHNAVKTDSVKRDTALLQAVTVVSRRRAVEPKIDGLVYHTAGEPQVAGGSAIDVLRKVPLLSLNQNGDVSVAGQTSVRIYIDDKPSELYGSSAADYLSQLSADRIDRVRVITNPSAKYDAEGGGAVILIYTKKNRLKNLTGTMRLNGSYGPYRKNALAGINLFYKAGKLGFSLGAGYSSSTFYREGITERKATDNSSAVNQQLYDTMTRNSPSVNFGVDMEIDSLNSLNLSASLVTYDYTNLLQQQTQLVNANGVRNYSRTTDLSGVYRYPTVSLAYNKRFKRSERELSFLGYYTSRNTDLDYQLSQLEQNTMNYGENFFNTTNNDELSLQTDYVHPAGKKNKWETGIKALFRKAGSDFKVLPYDAARSGSLLYEQQVYAAYLSYETVIGKWQLRTGIRYEQTNIDASFNTNKVNIDPYKNGIPNMLLVRNFKNNNALSFSYTQTLTRPGMNNLNPAVNYYDSLNISKGNPALDPQLAHRLEAAYTFRLKSASFLRLSLYGQTINNSFVQVRRLLPEGIAQTTWENIGRDRRIWFSANWNQTLSKQCKIVLVLNTSWRELQVPEMSLYNNGSWLFASAYINYVFKNGITFDGFIMSQTPSIELQSRYYTITPQYYFITVSKRFWKDKLGVSLNMDSFLNPQQAFYTDYKDAAFTQREIYYNSNQIFQIRLNYRFNQTVSETRTRAGNKAQGVPRE